MARSQQRNLNELSLLTREILLAYPQALFPMAQSASADSYHWYRPERRGIMPLSDFHASRSLRRFLKTHQNQITFHLNKDFEGTMRHCANREDTWISEPIITAFCELNTLGIAHSLTVEIDGEEIGGIYGLAMGRAFFGESMYSLAPNGSKLALWALVNELKSQGFELFDTQYITDHLARLGAIEIHADLYQARLYNALEDWLSPDYGIIAQTASRRDLRRIALERGAFVGTVLNPDIITRMIHS